MKTKLLLILLPVMFLLTGCPYNSTIPLSETTKIPIDKALVGTWKSKEEKDSSVIKIYAFNKTELSIVVAENKANGVEVDSYRAYATMVGDQVLMNLESLKAKGSYNFFSYKVEGDVLRLKTVSDIVLKEKYESSKAMKKAFAQKIKEKDFYESELVFVKVK